jgi:hypothetical protein
MKTDGRRTATTVRHGAINTLTIAMAMVAATSVASVAWAANQVGTSDSDVLIGLDDDNVNNPVIQPPGVPANQSLNNTDIQVGGRGHDILIGLQGNDVQLGDDGDDIFIGGPEGGTAPPNSDVQFGGRGNDISIWAPGDGSDAFIGGQGTDVQIVGLIDRVATASLIPLLSNPTNKYPEGRPSVNVTGLNAFCTLERVADVDPELGYEFLLRFRNAAGNIVVTIRLSEVEQVICPNLAQGNTVLFADLTDDNPQLVPVPLDQLPHQVRFATEIIR